MPRDRQPAVRSDPIGPGEALFREAFYADCKRCLTPGGVIVTQSGAYGAHVFVAAQARGLGANYWVTTGNEVDVEIVARQTAETSALAAQIDASNRKKDGLDGEIRAAHSGDRFPLATRFNARAAGHRRSKRDCTGARAHA